MGTRKRKRQETNIITSVNALPFSKFLEQHYPKDGTSFAPQANSKADSGNQPNFQLTSHASRKTKVTPDESHIIQEADIGDCVSLIEKTSRKDYEASAIGWSASRKRGEADLEDMRFIIARNVDTEHVEDSQKQQGSTFAGFLSFMFVYEDGHPVIYIYEIHLEDIARGCGLGNHLLSIAEQIGVSVGVDKSMLTVFRSNKSTIEWYYRRGYTVDEYSPQDKRLRGGKVKQCDYLILSKQLHKLGTGINR